MKNLFLFILIINGFCINVIAQGVSKYEKEGDGYYFSYSFDKAIIKYNLAKKLSLTAQRKLADSYHHTYQPIQAEKVYFSIINEPNNVLHEDYYNYAMACKANGKYSEADKWMLYFSELKPTDLRSKDYLLNKDKLTDLFKVATDLAIHNLDINTGALDFGTAYFNDKIVFSSSRLNNYSNNKKYNWTRKPFWNIYVSDILDNQLINPTLFDEGLTSNLNDGPVSFSNDGKFIAFTRNKTHDRSKDRIVELQIHFSNYKDGAWSYPIPFILNNPNYSVAQPCLTQDGKTMYFSSDMPGGYGKADIYSMSKNENGEWTNAKNLGNIVNTEGDDMFPFITENQEKLYFASDGHFGLGGLDIFSCSLNELGFNNVTNLGSPINTLYNDYGFIINEISGKGFFTSDRIGGKGGDDIYAVSIAEPVVQFTVTSPIDNPVQQRVSETFPLRNYIFFNQNETTIPNRYILLTKSQVPTFSVEQLSIFSYKELVDRSKRQLVVYYNVLNILGDRMKKNPSATIKLVGSSENGIEDGLLMSNSVKDYLTNTFEIASQRIIVEGRKKPKIPSEQPGGKLELALLQEGDRRVSVESNFPAILKEFEIRPEQSKVDMPFQSTKSTPINNEVLFTVIGDKDIFPFWSLELKSSQGEIQTFGPFSTDQVSISKNLILGSTKLEDNYGVTMIGQTKHGLTIKKQAYLHLESLTTPTIEELTRFSIIFEFDDSKSINIYEKYLSEVVTPKISDGSKVILYGYTDIIGTEIHNTQLSLQRMRTVRSIIEKSLQKLGIKDIVFEVYWYGENEDASPFANSLPEERFYNRTVIIDIIPRN